MERQGRSYIGFQIFPGSIFLGVVLAVLLLSVSGWGACSSGYQQSGQTQEGSFICSQGSCSAGGCSWSASCAASRAVLDCPETYQTGGGYFTDVYKGTGLQVNSLGGTTACTQSLTCVNAPSSGTRFTMGCYYRVRCTSKCEADSIACLIAGNFWDSQNCTCNSSCPQCDAFEQACDAESGLFTGSCLSSGGSTCCQGVCDVCSGEAMKKLHNMKVQTCCEQGLAPPSLAQVCYTQGIGTGCGVEWSKYKELNSGEWACQSPGLSVDAANRYRELCFGESSSSMAESSSGGGGSSSGEGSSSSGPSPYPEGCEECPWLDSILDTLTAQKHKVDNIENCIKYPALCGVDENNEPQIDTSILPYIRPFMDSSIKLTNEQIQLLVDLDTNILRVLAELQKLPESDTAVKLAIDAMSSNIEGKLTTVNTSVVNMNDSTKKWLRRLADSLHVLNDSNGAYIGRVADKIGISTDSLVKHLDSIKERIPSAVLDSILKYQKLAAESSDSIVLGDLPSIDSLIDSTVRYWKELREYDSVHHAKISDSLGTLHDAIDDISWRMGVIMGYGDTASSNLRGDINAVEGAVNVFRDSSLYYWRQSLSADSAYRVQFGNDMQTVTGTMGTVVINQDTANVRLGRIGDVVGDIDAKLNEGSYDTSSVYDGYLNGHDTSAVNFTNDLAGALNVALQDSSYANIFGSSSSVGSSGSDGSWVLPNVDSAHQVLRANVDSSLQSITDNMENIFDTLKREFVLVNWDSAIIAPLGMKVPNTNTCPEDCFAIDLRSAGGIFANIQSFNWGLCRTYPILGGMNVMQFIRLVLRIVTAFACVYIGMWFIAGKRD